MVTRLDRGSFDPDLYRMFSELTQRAVEFKVLDDPSSRIGKLVKGILALIAEFENGIRRERQHDGINKAKAAGVPKPLLTLSMIEKGSKPCEQMGRPYRRSCAVPSSATSIAG